jgi:hypothetical protein
MEATMRWYHYVAYFFGGAFLANTLPHLGNGISGHPFQSEAGGVKSVAIPAQSLNCNPCAERFVKTVKYECLNHFVIFGERHLRHLIKEFVEHYMTERFHQGIGGQLIRNVGPTNDNGADGKVACRSRLGGLLNYYHREAA